MESLESKLQSKYLSQIASTCKTDDDKLKYIDSFRNNYEKILNNSLPKLYQEAYIKTMQNYKQQELFGDDVYDKTY